VNEPSKEMIHVSAKLIPCIAPLIQTDKMYDLWNYFMDYTVIQSHNIGFESNYFCLIEKSGFP
jgi:hypothetical protein